MKANVLFQSTLSMRRAIDQRGHGKRSRVISIHALHEESDASSLAFAIFLLFQSTLSMRRAILRSNIHVPLLGFQSTLSMRRAIDLSSAHQPKATISIHALHEESDHRQRHPIRRGGRISIHALHEESDSAAGHFCPLFETQASCLALSISNNTADTTNNMSKTSNWLSVSF